MQRTAPLASSAHRWPSPSASCAAVVNGGETGVCVGVAPGTTPQQAAFVCGVYPHAAVLNAVRRLALIGDATATGRKLIERVPVPSWPSEFEPQHCTTP